jgi:hypothetical protein
MRIWSLAWALILLTFFHPPASGANPSGRFGRARYTYRARGLDPTNFDIINTIDLTYLGESNSTISPSTVTWSTPSDCTITNASSTKSSMACSVMGVKLVQITRTFASSATLTDNFYITVTGKGECFDWYGVLSSGAPQKVSSCPSTEQPRVLLLWIIDYNSASVDELNGVALSPSYNSLQLTQSFYSSGEVSENWER